MIIITFCVFAIKVNFVTSLLNYLVDLADSMYRWIYVSNCFLFDNSFVLLYKLNVQNIIDTEDEFKRTRITALL